MCVVNGAEAETWQVRAEDQSHVGIVVDDFEAALADLSGMFGYEWRDELGGPIQVRASGSSW